MDIAQPKKWYTSKTIWSAIGAALVAGLSQYYGQGSLYETLAIAVLSAIGIYGRTTATRSIK